MRFAPIIVFFIYIYLEVSFFVLIANNIGVFLALLFIIVTSIIGLSLVKYQGLKNFILMQEKMANNQNPNQEIIKGTSLFLAGFFLLIPGFLTDILGVILLLPPTQYILSRFIVPKANIYTRFTRYGSYQQNGSSNHDIIEGEFKKKND